MHEQNAVFTMMARCPSVRRARVGEWEEGWQNWDDLGAKLLKNFYTMHHLSFIYSWRILEATFTFLTISLPLASFVHLSTSKQLPRVHTVLERHLVDTLKAFRLYKPSFFVVIFRVYFIILFFTANSHWYRFSCLFFLFPFIKSFDWSQFQIPSPRQM